MTQKPKIPKWGCDNPSMSRKPKESHPWAYKSQRQVRTLEEVKREVQRSLEEQGKSKPKKEIPVPKGQYPRKFVPQSPIPSEDEEQVKVVVWLSKHNKLFYAVPNGGKRGQREAIRLKAGGVRPGVPDLCVPMPSPDGRYHGLYIEMKRIKKSTTSEYQEYWIEQLTAMGYKALICKGAAEAIAVCKEYFGMENSDASQ